MILRSCHQEDVIRTTIFIISILLKNSPEIFLHNNIDSPQTGFIFSIFDLPKMLKFLLLLTSNIFINFEDFFFLLSGLVKLLVFNKYTIYFELNKFLFSPIIIYLTVQLLLQFIEEKKMLDIVLLGTYLIANIFILIWTSVYLGHFSYQIFYYKSINSVRPLYDIVQNLRFIFLFSFPFVKTDPLIGIAVLIFFNLIKGLLMLNQINYQSIFIEYCLILSEITSWVQTISIGLTVYYKVDCTILYWINLFMIFFLIVKKNRMLVFFLEQKYHKSIIKAKQLLTSSIKSNQLNTAIFQEYQLIEMFICLIYLTERKANRKKNGKQSQEGQNFLTISFSNHFSAEILSLTETFCHLDGYGESQNIFSSRDSQSSFSEASAEIKWAFVWKIATKLSQVQRQSYRNLRSFLIHQFPLLNSSFNYRLLHLHYMNMKQSKSISFFQNILLHIDYEYLTQKIFLQYKSSHKNSNHQAFVDSMLKQQNTFIANHQSKSMAKNEYYFQKQRLCLTYSNSVDLKSSTFDVYYQQTIVETQIQSEFIEFLQIQETILTQIKKKQSKNLLMKLLLKRNQKKYLIKNKIQTIQLTNAMKSTIYNFILSTFIQNVPSIALNNLNQSNFKSCLQNKTKNEDNYFRKKTATIINLKNESLYHSKKSDGRMILVLSKIQAFGKIVNCCSNFRSKIELRNLSQTSSSISGLQKATINDIILPVWIDRHLQQIHKSTTFGNPACHKGRKFHLLSLIEKNIFEVNFQIHYVLRKMDDLLLALDISYKEIDKMCVYNSKEEKVFQSLTNKYASSRLTMYRRKTAEKKDKAQMFKEMKGYQTYQQMVFGQQYKFMLTYKSTQQRGNSHRTQRTNKMHHTKQPSLSQFSNKRPQSMNPEAMKHCESRTHFTQMQSLSSFQRQQIPQSASFCTPFTKSLSNEIKMKEYVQQNLFFKEKLFFFTSIHWSIPPFILTVSLLMRYLAAERQVFHNSLFMTKLSINKNYLLVDTHLINSLYYLNQLRFSNDTQHESQSQLMPIFNLVLSDLKYNTDILYKRQLMLNEIIQNQCPVTNLLFGNIGNHVVNTESNSSKKSHIESFYYSSLNYDLQVDEYLALIGLNFKIESQQVNISEVLSKSSRKKLNIERFFRRFNHRYEEFFESQEFSAISTNIHQFQAEAYEQAKFTFSLLLIGLAVVAFLPAIQFMITFIDLRYNIEKMVLTCLNFSQSSLRKVKNKIDQTKEILENCKDQQNISLDFPYKCRKALSFQNSNSFAFNEKQSSHINLGQSMKSHNIHTKFQGNYNKFYDRRLRVAYRYLPEIMVFVMIVTACEVLLILLVNSLRNEIVQVEKYSNGAENITTLIALSNQIGLELMFAKDQTTRLQNAQKKIEQFWKADKLNNIRDIQNDQTKFEKLVFRSICKVDQLETDYHSSICTEETLFIDRSYSQAISWSILNFKALHTHMQASLIQNDTTLSFQKLNLHYTRIVKTISILNRFAHQMNYLTIQNYKHKKQNPGQYFDLLIVQMVVIIVLFNWYTYYQLYKEMKRLYEEVFSFCSFEEMNRMMQFSFYCNQAQQQRISFTEGKY